MKHRVPTVKMEGPTYSSGGQNRANMAYSMKILIIIIGRHIGF
jgi:hypothetical protein